MGRAFYTAKHSEPVVASPEPEPTVPPYATWSRWNYFDPDSDEFFHGAQREIFTDTDEYKAEQERIRASVVLDASAPASSASSEGSEPSDRGSPMAVDGEPTYIIPDAYSSADWERRFLLAGADDTNWRRSRTANQQGEPVTFPLNRGMPVTVTYNSQNFRGSGPDAPSEPVVRPRRLNRPRSATVSSLHIPSSSLRPSSVPTVDANAPPANPATPHLRHANVTPVIIPTEPSSPSPISPDSPTTPTDNSYPPQMHTLFTPSPPPSVTPHMYTWSRRVVPIPPSPLGSHQGPVGMLNPSARMSLAHVNVLPPPMRVQNAAI